MKKRWVSSMVMKWKKNKLFSKQTTTKQQSIDMKWSYSLRDNLELLQNQLQIANLIHRQFLINHTKEAAILFVKGLADEKKIQEKILHPLMYEHHFDQFNPLAALYEYNEVKELKLEDIIDKLLHGDTILIIDGLNKLFVFNTTGIPKRSIEEPQTESMLKGIHQGFIEVLEDNISMIRQFIDGPQLKIKNFQVGSRKKNTIAIMYLQDLVHQDVVKELEKRIQQLNVDTLLTIGTLEELIEDNPYSPLPQFISTERPDTVSIHLLQGRIAILINHSSAVLIGPATFSSFFQTVDDYSIRWIVTSFIRVLRYIAFYLSILLPPLYIAVLSFHYEVIPINLYVSVAESREAIPFSPILEAFIMEITLETLREAGLRLPAPIGQTVGIVGGIVIGQAAVEAGLVSNIMVIIVALTAISSFILPNQDFAAGARLLRFPFMLISALFGMVGMMFGVMILIGHVISLESLGTPYGNPFAPTRFKHWGDLIIRLPKTGNKLVEKARRNS
jgi:spore germination protein